MSTYINVFITGYYYYSLLMVRLLLLLVADGQVTTTTCCLWSGYYYYSLLMVCDCCCVTVRSVLVVHGLLHLLAARHVEGREHWSDSGHVVTNGNVCSRLCDAGHCPVTLLWCSANHPWTTAHR